MSLTRRRLVALDAQSLLGCRPRDASVERWAFAIHEALDAVHFDEDADHLVIAVAPEWAFIAATLAPPARLMVQSGRHGADRALRHALEDADFIASRYSEVVVASGSRLLCRSVAALAEVGVTTTVAGLPRHTSGALAAAASRVTWLTSPGSVLGDAARVGEPSTRTPRALVHTGAAPRAAARRPRLGLAA